MEQKEFFKNNQFYDDVINPALDVFARDYGLEREYGSLFTHRNAQHNDLIGARKFITLFNIENESKYWMYKGRPLKFKIDIDNENYEPYYITREATKGDFVLFGKGYDKIGIVGYTRNLLILSFIVIQIITSGTNYFYLAPAYLASSALVFVVGRRVGAKLGYILW